MTNELIWQHQDVAGWEHVRVIRDHPGWTVFDSILVREHEGEVLRGGYTLVLDKDWRTLELRLMIETSPGTMEGIHLLSEGDGRWSDSEDHHIPELDGCMDVGIQWSPLTSSLPANRLSLEQGSEEKVRVVHISLPDLVMTPMEQEHKRLDDQKVQISTESQTAIVEIDSDGFVRGFEGFFRRTWPE